MNTTPLIIKWLYTMELKHKGYVEMASNEITSNENVYLWRVVGDGYTLSLRLSNKSGLTGDLTSPADFETLFGQAVGIGISYCPFR